MKTTLYGWGALFDLPSPSPYVMKADIQMQMLGLDFERAIADLESVGKHKAPYVRDDDVLIEDSTFIRWHFEHKLGVDLDQGLSTPQRGQAWALERMLENRLAQLMACERWLVDENFDRGPRMFFMRVPEPMRETVIKEVRDNVAKTMHGSGFARFTRSEQMQLARADIAATVAMLGDKPYFFGDAPTAVDAAAYSVIAGCATRFFKTELVDIVEEHANLMAYLERMQSRYFALDRWPRMV